MIDKPETSAPASRSGEDHAAQVADLITDWQLVVDGYGYTEPTCLEVRTLKFCKTMVAILSHDSGEAVKPIVAGLRQMARQPIAEEGAWEWCHDACIGMNNAADTLEALSASAARLTEERDALASLRPVWSQGWTTDSIAAQASTVALSQMWKHLGVSDQTTAVAALKRLIEERDKAVAETAETTRLTCVHLDNMTIATKQAERVAREAIEDNKRLREALEKYGSHPAECGLKLGRVCNCEYGAILRLSTTASPPEGQTK